MTPARIRTPLVPLGVAVVRGPSMTPTLRDGDMVLVRYGAAPRAGALVLARRPDRPEIVMVKRAAGRYRDGWRLLGDNPYGSDDSRVFGLVPAELILGRVLVRLWPWRRGWPWWLAGGGGGWLAGRVGQRTSGAAPARGRTPWARRRAR